MRIGIDARFYGGEQSKGLGRYTQKLVEHLLAIDTSHQYVFFVSSKTRQDWPHHQDNVELVEVPYPWYSVSEQIAMPSKIRQQKVDFMHFPHFNVPLLYNDPFIVTIHDLIISRFPTSRATTLGPTKYKIKQFAYNRVISHAAHKAKKIITVSNYSKQDIIDFFHIPENDIDVTYESVDDFSNGEASEEQAKRIRAEYDLPESYILYIGNAYPHKNLEILLKVVAKLKKQHKLDFKLVFVGKEDYFYLRLQQQAWALDVDREVLFPGFIPDEHLAAVYKGALTYVFPSQYEGFGLPPLEAMYYGTPVVSSNASCLPEVLGDAALYFDFQDVDGIIKQIFRLQEDQKFRSNMINKGHQQVKEYSWRTMAEETLQIYESVFSKS